MRTTPLPPADRRLPRMRGPERGLLVIWGTPSFAFSWLSWCARASVAAAWLMSFRGLDDPAAGNSSAMLKRTRLPEEIRAAAALSIAVDLGRPPDRRQPHSRRPRVKSAAPQARSVR